MSLSVAHAAASQADVCIVGAGPVGAVAAKRLAEAGLSVVVLERGGWPDPLDAPGTRARLRALAGKGVALATG